VTGASERLQTAVRTSTGWPSSTDARAG
jgi:hypothetical protein